MPIGKAIYRHCFGYIFLKWTKYHNRNSGKDMPPYHNYIEVEVDDKDGKSRYFLFDKFGVRERRSWW